MGGFAPPPLEPLPIPESREVQVRPAAPPRPLPPGAGYAGKAGQGLNVAANFLHGWISGKQMGQQKRLAEATSQVRNARNLLELASRDYAQVAAMVGGKKKEEWSPEEKEAIDRAAETLQAAWGNFQQVAQPYLAPEKGQKKEGGGITSIPFLGQMLGGMKETFGRGAPPQLVQPGELKTIGSRIERQIEEPGFAYGAVPPEQQLARKTLEKQERIEGLNKQLATLDHGTDEFRRVEAQWYREIGQRPPSPTQERIRELQVQQYENTLEETETRQKLLDQLADLEKAGETGTAEYTAARNQLDRIEGRKPAGYFDQVKEGIVRQLLAGDRLSQGQQGVASMMGMRSEEDISPLRKNAKEIERALLEAGATPEQASAARLQYVIGQIGSAKGSNFPAGQWFKRRDEASRQAYLQLTTEQQAIATRFLLIPSTDPERPSVVFRAQLPQTLDISWGLDRPMNEEEMKQASQVEDRFRNLRIQNMRSLDFSETDIERALGPRLTQQMIGPTPEEARDYWVVTSGGWEKKRITPTQAEQMRNSGWQIFDKPPSGLETPQ